MSVSGLVYLDTSALLRRAETLVTISQPRPNLMKPHLDALFANTNVTLGLSEISILEYNANLAGHVRRNEVPEWDFAWYQAAQSDLYGAIAEGRIQVIEPPAKYLELAMTLVSRATHDFGRAMWPWDAAHMLIAAKWAHDEGSPVQLLTCDKDFDLLAVFKGFSAHVSLLDLDVLASTGVGRDST
jgi:hypothetical protein